jgi:hypothetical protein
MAVLNEVAVSVKADPAGLIRFARIVEKHFGALADDLEKLGRDEEAPAPVAADLDQGTVQ